MMLMRSISQIWIVFLGISCVSSQVEWKHGFSKCRNGVRTMYYYTESDQTCTSAANDQVLAKAPVHELDCNMPCDKGFFLGVNASHNPIVSACEKCPKGTYSLGGGTLYSQTTNAWKTPLPDQIFTECLTKDMLSGEWSASCNEWKASEDGKSIHSGANSGLVEQLMAARLVSLLRLSVTFVRDGTITFQYQVDAEEPYDGLLFIVDANQEMTKVSKSKGWQEKTVNITAGTHMLTWQFVKDYSGDAGADKAAIKVIQLEGTGYSDTHCHQCAEDMLKRGDSVCRFCDRDEYAGNSKEDPLEFTCHKCPEGNFSLAGSIGIQSCRSRRPCTESDYNAQYSECVEGHRAANYFWTTPHICDSSLPGAVALPSNKTSIPCGTCNEGYYMSMENVCTACEGNEYSTATKDTPQQKIQVCKPCPKNHVPLRHLEYGQNTSDGWAHWPEIIDSTMAQKNNWKLSHNSISTNTLAKTIDNFASYQLSMNITCATPGRFEFKYALHDLPEESGSFKAWLELSLDGTPMVLEHGKHNGQHNESIEVPEGPHSIDFYFIATGNVGGSSAGVRLQHLKFVGTEIGGATSCTKCPAGSVPNKNGTACKACRGGTSTGTSDSGNECGECPENTFSKEGSESCSKCGSGMQSNKGADVCTAPTVITAAGGDRQPLSYSLALLQNLVSDKKALATTADQKLLGSETLNATKLYPGGGSEFYTFGIFQLAVPAVGSTPHMEVNQKLLTGAYVQKLIIKNEKEIDKKFVHNVPPYGQVECRVPTLYKYEHMGNFIESIRGDEGGVGVMVKYSGDACKGSSSQPYETTIRFLCDLSAGNDSSPLTITSNCSTTFEWRTPYACPICTKELFAQSRSECVNGAQNVELRAKIPCFGGYQPPHSSLVSQTCASITLDKKTMTSLYAGVILTALLFLTLVAFIIFTYRKYKNADAETQYLKGMLRRESVRSGNETVFEFDDVNNSIANSPAQGTKKMTSTMQSLTSTCSTDSEDRDHEMDSQFRVSNGRFSRGSEDSTDSESAPSSGDSHLTAI